MQGNPLQWQPTRSRFRLQLLRTVCALALLAVLFPAGSLAGTETHGSHTGQNTPPPKLA
ncbi:MAG TPA: hypothetical protein VKU00_05170 [Chthonomonadaceae bacterium]|nr:hypothetical protein [Chthonomonadaceae bacterium]